MVCGTIWGCTINKNYYYIDVVSIQIVPHWGTNRECGTNQGNKVSLVTIHVTTVKLYDNSIL